jgi:2-polyprenyl-6-methoxyphenol hydroxylase-like FAD-dependent oxidoreductase
MTSKLLFSASVANPPLDHVDVVVVGFGPTGATLAALLAQRGCRVVVIESSPTLNPDPRASFFDGDSLRVWQQMGCADEISAASIPLPGLHFRNTKGDLVLDWPMPAGAGSSSWPASNLLHQPELEAILRRRVQDLGVEVRLGERVVAVSQGDEFATVLTTSTTGTAAQRARFVVGCDGGSSAVRAALAVGWEDFDCTLRWRLADVEIIGDSDLLDVTTAVMDPSGPSMVGHLAHNRYRWLWLQSPGHDQTFPDDDEVLSSLTHGVSAQNARLTRQAAYVAHARVAKQWASGRVLIAGDAAHLLPPLLGQGIGAGIRDAANLAWKLAAVLHSELPTEALCTYESERKPHTRAIVGLSAAISSYVFTWDAVVATERDARLAAGDVPLELIPVPVPLGESSLRVGELGGGSEFPQWRMENDTRTDELLGDGFAVVVAPGSGSRRTELLALLLGTLGMDLTAWQTNIAHDETVDRLAAPWLAANGLTAVLVRPDRMVAGVVAAVASEPVSPSELLVGAGS